MFFPHRGHGFLYGGVTRRRRQHSGAVVERVDMSVVVVGHHYRGRRTGPSEALDEVHEVTWGGVNHLGGHGVDYYRLARWRLMRV